MERKREYSGRWLLLFLGGLLSLMLLVLAVGSTRAHYELSTFRRQNLFYQNTEAEVYILGAEKDNAGAYLREENGNIAPPAGWQKMIAEKESGEEKGQTTLPEAEAIVSAEEYTLSFLLANGQRQNTFSAETQEATLTLFATEGLASPERVSITLTDSGVIYDAIVTEVKQGSAWYDSYGPGWIYQFYDSAGEELCWTLYGGSFSARELMLTLYGTGEAAALLTLIVSAYPI